MTTDAHGPRCSRCGGPLDGDAGGVCPACLLRLGLDDDGDRAETQPRGIAGDHRPGPETIGPYRLGALLGEGGMGRVFVAHQETPIRRTVALKLIKPGVDSRETLQRFEVERRSLELMEHPSIARVLDAGSTPDGQPYFVMEYVDGLPITRFCDEHRLSTEARIRLVVRVCDAIQHAHVKGVIHRDLKPSNVLVSMTNDGPLPKVIDFGIAKATGERMLDWSHHTEMGRLIGTPEYMSPEQADTGRRDVDTRTDVYALGVLLYELLVGRTPHDARAIREAGLEEMLRRIRETDLPTPSARLSTLGDDVPLVARERSTDPARLVRLVRGELDWITMRALEKDRERRYGSSRELAADLERYLADEPVEARAPSAVYRARKFVRRHRAPVGVAVAALVTLVGFAGAMAWQARQIAVERDRARVEAETAEQVSSLMVDLFRSADPFQLAAGEPTARDVLEAGVERMTRELADRPAILARMLAEMGWALDGLGDHARAASLLEQAVESYRDRLGLDDERTLRALHHLAWARGHEERWDDAEALFREVATRLAAIHGPADRRALRQRLELPELWLDAGMSARAIPELEALLADQRAALGHDDEDTLVTGLFLGVALGHVGRTDEAAPYVDAALVGLRMPAAADDRRRAAVLMRLGWSCLVLRRFKDAERVYRDVLVHRERALGGDHPQTLRTRSMLASVLDEQGRHAEAGELTRSILDARLRTLGSDHPETLLTYSLLGDTLIREKRFAAAEEQFRAAIAGHLRRGSSSFHLTRARLGLAQTLRFQGRLDEALRAYEQVQADCDTGLGDRHPICRVMLQDTLLVMRERGDTDAVARIEARLAALEP